jgi:Clp amino terminal domain, pathogenicity island component/UvrB/uvrC motif
MRRAVLAMFERFTDRARQVLVLAQVEARQLNHDYIGTEHILLGLIGEGEGVAAKALELLGISLASVRRQVREVAGQGEDHPSGPIPFTPQVKKVLELAQRESRALGHTYIGTEHILLGLLREGDGVAVQVLVSLGADLNAVRQRVIQLLHGYQGKVATGGGSRLGRRARGSLADEALTRIDSLNLDELDGRLAAIERWVGMRPDLEDLDQEIGQVRRGKEDAAGQQDFEAAAALRDKESQLVAAREVRERGWHEATASRVSMAKELDRLNSELQRLRAILRQHGIEPGVEPGDDVA